MASLTVVRSGVKDRLATIDGLRASATLPSVINPPAAWVMPAPGRFIDWDTTMSRGTDDMYLVVYLVVGKASDRAAQDTMDAYLAGSGTQSIKAAVEGDQTLGGVAMFVTVTEARNYGPIQIGDDPNNTYLGCEFPTVVGVAGT